MIVKAGKALCKLKLDQISAWIRGDRHKNYTPSQGDIYWLIAAERERVSFLQKVATGGMAQWLSALTAPLEDQGSIPSIYLATPNCLLLLQFHGTRYAECAYIHTHTSIDIHIHTYAIYIHAKYLYT